MRRSSHTTHTSLNELNVTPLLDLVFSLLIIFIITTPQLMNNLEMTLPSGQVPPADPAVAPPAITRIEVTANGQTYLNQEPVSLDHLRQRLRQLQAADPDPAVVVKGDDAVDYQHMVNVLDVLQQLAITKVGLATVENPAATR
ncbi:MAG: biopolymer transporter ExbD [Verrucomicrobiales bacterium]|nr:biopolymer transporter ExbD [Verrucomicrobiales bacterium]